MVRSKGCLEVQTHLPECVRCKRIPSLPRHLSTAGDRHLIPTRRPAAEVPRMRTHPRRTHATGSEVPRRSDRKKTKECKVRLERGLADEVAERRAENGKAVLKDKAASPSSHAPTQCRSAPKETTTDEPTTEARQRRCLSANALTLPTDTSDATHCARHLKHRNRTCHLIPTRRPTCQSASNANTSPTLSLHRLSSNAAGKVRPRTDSPQYTRDLNETPLFRGAPAALCATDVISSTRTIISCWRSGRSQTSIFPDLGQPRRAPALRYAQPAVDVDRGVPVSSELGSCLVSRRL
jgi:hypothetical protein